MSLLLALVLASQVGPSNELARVAEALAAETIARDGVPGIQLAVVRDGEEFLVLARGVADDAHGTPVTADTRFVLGSAARIVTSAAVLQLVDAGEFALDADVATLVDGLPKLAQPVALERVLDGTSGIAPWARVFAAAKREPRAGLAKDDVLALFAAAPFDSAPGERYAPNSAAWALLPLVLERAWGESFVRGAPARLFAPFGFEHAGFVSGEVPLSGLARDCAAVAEAHDAEVLLALDRGWVAPMFACDARELARFVDAVGTGRVMSAKTAERMFSSARTGDGKPTGHGVGFDLDRVAGHPRAGHSGGLGGTRVRVAWYGEDRLAVVVFANCAGADVERLEEEVARYVLGVGFERVVEVPVGEAEVKRFGGVYQIATERVRVFERGGRLVWQTADRERELKWQGRGGFVDAAEVGFGVRFELGGEVSQGVEVTRAGGVVKGVRVASVGSVNGG